METHRHAIDTATSDGSSLQRTLWDVDRQQHHYSGEVFVDPDVTISTGHRKSHHIGQ